MKKLIVIPLILVTIAIQAQKSRSKQQPEPEPAAEVKLNNNGDSSQYILGAYLGQYMQANGLAVTNANLFLKGMDDVITGKPLMVPSDSIPKRMGEYLSKMAIERSKLLETKLFEAVKGQPGVGTLPNGVCYVIAKAGTGLRPLPSDSITFHVKGYLPEGSMFEDTYTKNTPLKAVPANLIPGLREAVQIMPEGSVWRIYIPSAQAYADKGVAGVIPPFSAIVFDIELLSINKKQEQTR